MSPDSAAPLRPRQVTSWARSKSPADSGRAATRISSRGGGSNCGAVAAALFCGTARMNSTATRPSETSRRMAKMCLMRI